MRKKGLNEEKTSLNRVQNFFLEMDQDGYKKICNFMLICPILKSASKNGFLYPS
jgi:hypothetical protein